MVQEGLYVNELFLTQAIKTREDWESLYEVTEGELELEKSITEQQYLLIEQQWDQIAYQKQHITDSIEYAKMIRAAILPSMELFSHKVEHFVVFKPRDIVSGDFYWVEEISRPDQVLNQLRDKIIEALRQKTGSIVKDGMDLTVCLFDRNTLQLQFSGANNPLYLVSDGQLSQIKGDKMPVAINDIMDPFTLHQLSLKRGDTFYNSQTDLLTSLGARNERNFSQKILKTCYYLSRTSP